MLFRSQTMKSQRPQPTIIPQNTTRHLGDDGAGGGGLVLPGGRQDTDGLVVASETVDTRLDENETELGVLVLAVALSYRQVGGRAPTVL